MSAPQSPTGAESTYPTLVWLVRMRRFIQPIQWTCGLLATALGGWLAWRTGWPELAPIVVLITAAGLMLARSYLELVDLISDMLLPK